MSAAVPNLSQALRTANSGLLVNQRVIDTIAQNVANANTEGYSRKNVILENRSVDGVALGVQISEITRNIDEGLLKSFRLETSELNELTIQNDYFARMQDLFSSPEENDSLSHILSEFGEAVEELVMTPERSLEKAEVVRRAEDITSMLRDMTKGLQELRLQADQELSAIATSVNSIVNKVDELNDKIVINTASKNDTSDLKDQRDVKLNELAKYIDVRYFFRGDGDVVVYTASGKTLVETVPPTITHTSASSVSASTTHADGSLSGFYFGDTSLSTNDGTNEIRDGQAKGLIDIRDSIIPNLQSQLDDLAATLTKTVNQIHNRGVAFPGGQTYNGTRIFTEPTTQSIKLDPTGSVDDVKLALFDSSGDQSDTTTLNTIMTAAGFSARGTSNDWHISDVATTIQSWLRNNGASSATVATDSTTGKLNISLNTTSLNLAFRDETASSNGSTHSDAEIAYDSNGDGVIDETVSGFSNFFGLNDFFVDEQKDNIWETDVLASTFTGTATTLTFRDTSGAIGSLSIAANQTLTEIAAAINADNTISAKVTANVIPDGSGYRLRVSHDNGTNMQVTQANGNTFMTNTGLDVADVRISATINVRSDIILTPSLITTGAVQWDSARGVSGEYLMSAGDETIIKALAEQLNTNLTFKLSGGLASVASTFAQRAAEIVGNNAILADDNERDSKMQQALTDSLEHKQKSAAGVNLDEEMALLIVYEQAYAAAARCMTTVNNMFEALERIAA